MLYLDTAALVKLVRREPESDALVDWLSERVAQPWVTSVLAEVELGRALRRTGPDLLSAVPALLARLYRCEIDATVRATAAAYPDPALRALDAIHLATAEVVLRRRTVRVRHLRPPTARRRPAPPPHHGGTRPRRMMRPPPVTGSTTWAGTGCGSSVRTAIWTTPGASTRS